MLKGDGRKIGELTGSLWEMLISQEMSGVEMETQKDGGQKNGRDRQHPRTEVVRSDEIEKVMTKRVKRKGELRKQGETTHTDEKTNDTWLQSMELG